MGDQCSPAFAFMLFCAPEHVPLLPSLSFCRFIPEAVVQYQNYHINQITNVWAVDLMPPGSLYACLSFSVLTSVFQCIFFFRPICSYISICIENHLEQRWGICGFQKPIVTAGLFFFASKLHSTLISKSKIRSLLSVKHRLRNNRMVMKFKSVWTAYKSCSVAIHVDMQFKSLSLHGKT